MLRHGERMKQTKDFYRTSKWKKKRIRILRRDKYKCQEAKRFGLYEEATTVHHIYPREEYPQLSYEDWNLISVSGSRHGTFHDKTTGTITERGRYWQNKRKRELDKWNKRNAQTN